MGLAEVLLGSPEKKFIMYGGKGGLGKTTFSAATAYYLASKGKRVLVFSVDPQASLSDIFENDTFGKGNVEVVPNLFAREVDADRRVADYQEEIRQKMETMMIWKMTDELDLTEEQAARLGVRLEEYSERAEGVSAPLASDRCTVFMERDINHYLNKKYTVNEILAAALYSVRENYLLKVASEALIGERICFQGATAKNRALVAAFEEKLKRKIFVSEYCHLTGALGVALSLRETLPIRSLRGSIPIAMDEQGYL